MKLEKTQWFIDTLNKDRTDKSKIVMRVDEVSFSGDIGWEVSIKIGNKGLFWKVYTPSDLPTMDQKTVEKLLKLSKINLDITV